MLKKSLGLVSGAALMFVFAYGCSSSSTTDTATDGGSSNSDGGKTDGGGSKTDGATPVDDGGPSCAPGDVSSYAPKFTPPIAFGSKKCSDTQVDAILDCIFNDAADAATCKKLLADKANTDCQDCLITPSSAKAYGPLIENGGIASINIAGCIANSDGNKTAAGCGAKYQAARDCADAACADACPGSDAAALKALQACETQALSGDCKKYADDANCADALLNTGGAAEACNAGNTFQEAAAALGKMFCGGGTAADGGTDAPADGG